MTVELKPIENFLEDETALERVPKEMILLAEKPLPWTGYLAFTDEETLVGMCAFKDVPDKHSRVEIAYFTFPEFERNGYATEMARSLVTIAGESDEAIAVLAHTLRTSNASARVCKRLGFRCQGEVTDPEDGLVWRWYYDLSE